MSATITIQLSPQAIALSEKFKRAPQEFPQAIKRGMTRALEITAGRIKETRLIGRGPFPATDHRLGQRTGQLELRTQSRSVVITTEGDHTVISGAIGTSARNKGFSYPLLHEFGGKFAPKRAPFRTGIRENMDYIASQIEAEIVKSLKA